MIASVDGRLLNALQTEFPLTAEPFAALARTLETTTQDVMARVADLKWRGIIRQIGPVVDARRLGFQSTLVAMKVTADKLACAEEIIAGHTGVSHGYERNHEYNVWFTLSVPPSSSINNELNKLARRTGAVAAFSLPVVKMFKLGAYFDVEGDGLKTPSTRRAGTGVLDLTPAEVGVLNELQQDLMLVSRPFDDMASNSGMTTDEFLAVARLLMEKGAIRRFSASINHRRAGFAANAMTCWAVPPEMVDTIGERLAALREVSHCYERAVNPRWQYNIFAMVHGHSPDVCEEIAQQIAGETGLKDYRLLYSTHEFKKARVKYIL